MSSASASAKHNEYMQVTFVSLFSKKDTHIPQLDVDFLISCNDIHEYSKYESNRFGLLESLCVCFRTTGDILNFLAHEKNGIDIVCRVYNSIALKAYQVAISSSHVSENSSLSFYETLLKQYKLGFGLWTDAHKQMQKWHKCCMVIDEMKMITGMSAPYIRYTLHDCITTFNNIQVYDKELRSDLLIQYINVFPKDTRTKDLYTSLYRPALQKFIANIETEYQPTYTKAVMFLFSCEAS